jgi:S-adenosylmethionine/arginine decarboxylase-like enzyme
MSTPWGIHLLVDASGCNEYINCVNNVRAFIIKLVQKIKMHPIGKPMVVYVDTEEGKGVSAVQLITTSTITFHGDDEGKRAFIDVFSCKEFDQQKVIDYIKEVFRPQKINTRLIIRDAENTI